MPADQVDQLARALDATGRIIAGVRSDQWASPTPNPGWNVRSLVKHMVTGNFHFGAVVGGAPATADAANHDGDLAAAYRDSGAAVLAAFRAPGALDQIVTVPMGTVPGVVALHLRITEILVHGWDVARATGQPAIFPRDLAEQELTFSRSKIGDIPPDRRPFAPPKPVADDAPPIDKLAAFLGRDVTKVPARPAGR